MTTEHKYTPRERVMLALSHQEPDRVPIDFGSNYMTSITLPPYLALEGALGIPPEPPRFHTPLSKVVLPREEILRRVRADTRGVPRPNAPATWRNQVQEDGTILDEFGVVWKQPAGVYSMQDNLFHRDVEDYTVEDASGTVIRFDSGGIAVFAASNGAIPNRWDYDMRVILPGLTADFEDANHAVFHHTGQEWSATTTIASEQDMHLAETLDLLAAIREDRSTAVPIEEGVRSLRLALAAARSAEEDAPIDIELSI